MRDGKRDIKLQMGKMTVATGSAKVYGETALRLTTREREDEG
jgi:hypothetical protein